MEEVLCDLLTDIEFGILDIEDFEDRLADAGFMIVPIEDPTNLRFGVDD